MGKPLAATDKRRQAGHKHHRHAGSEEESTGQAKPLAHLLSDRRARNGTGKRAK